MNKKSRLACQTSSGTGKHVHGIRGRSKQSDCTSICQYSFLLVRCKGCLCFTVPPTKLGDGSLENERHFCARRDATGGIVPHIPRQPIGPPSTGKASYPSPGHLGLVGRALFLHDCVDNTFCVCLQLDAIDPSSTLYPAARNTMEYRLFTNSVSVKKRRRSKPTNEDPLLVNNIFQSSSRDGFVLWLGLPKKYTCLESEYE